ncbi:MAG: TetR/AcrR family transcriptional regulator [Solirubrobacteraceae bacterium]
MTPPIPRPDRAAGKAVRRAVAARTGAAPGGSTPRRTQEERRAETRRRLLDATIQSLVDVGYAQTTSRHVAELAGVSRGAQTHHFPHRLDLIVEAYEQLANDRVAAIEAEVARAAGGADAATDGAVRVGELLDIVWRDFSSDLFRAGTKIWIAASDDAELRARLLPIEERLRRTIRETIRRLAGDLAEDGRLMARLDLCISTLRGLALSEAFEPRRRPSRIRRWELYRPLLEELVGEL